jgi:hypothetical protein
MDESQSIHLSDDNHNELPDDDDGLDGVDDDEIDNDGRLGGVDDDELQYLYMQESVQEYDKYANITLDELFENCLSDSLSEDINDGRF